MAFKWNDRLVSQMFEAVKDGVSDATTEVYEEVLHLVQDESKTGRIYKKPNGRVHQASAAGQSYASDTGNALKNTRQLEKDRGLVGEISADYEYALALEMGTTKMAPRPTLRRALQNKSKQLPQIMSNELKKLLKND